MNPTKPTELGPNRTGIAISPLDAQQMLEASEATKVDGGGPSLADVRHAYAAAAPPVGTVPPPANLKGLGTSIMQRLKGHNANALIDKLGERLAFERTGVRLYEALKIKVGHSAGPPPSIGDVEAIREEEFAHFRLVDKSLREIGADPTTVTPSADVIGVASSGALKVVTDPNTTLAQALNAMLMVELTDTAGWELLIPLARSYNLSEMADAFERALLTEEEHARKVKRWLAERTKTDAGVA